MRAAAVAPSSPRAAPHAHAPAARLPWWRMSLLLCAVAAFSGACALIAAAERPVPPPGRRLKAHGAQQQAAEGAPAYGTTVAYTPDEGYKSQEGQDKWVEERIFRGKRGGVFVDLGCYDGITYSNTWFWETQRGWTGVCVEPNPEVFPRIAAAGRSSGVQLAVSDHVGTANFVTAFMRSSLNETAVDYEFLASQGLTAREVATRVVTPRRLLLDHLPHERTIDYVNIDVESQELNILRVWPFDRVCVDVFNVENQPPHGEPSILPPLRELLEPQGYRHLLRIGVDEVFQRQPACEEQRGARRGGVPGRRQRMTSRKKKKK